MIHQDRFNPVVEVIEAIGSTNANKYLEKQWVLLGVIEHGTGDESCFIYSLGRLLDSEPTSIAQDKT